MAPVSYIMHRYGFRILRYLDDWLVLGSSFQEITRARDFLLWLCDQVGILVNHSKSTLTPSQRLHYLGMTLQSTPLRAFPTLWLSLLGVMSSLLTVVPGSRLRMRSLQHRLLVAGPQFRDDELISWDDSWLQDLRCWSVAANLEVGVPFDLPHPDLILYTDASDTGWGASLGSEHLSGLWSPSCSLYSINHRELLVIFLALDGFSQLLHHQFVALFMDNTTALSYLRKEGGTRLSTLNSVAQAILRFCEGLSIRLLPQFFPGKMNVLADALSRSSQVLGSEWTLCQEVCRELFRMWPVTIDLFATSLNNRLQVYFCPVVDPQAAGVDPMLQPWDHLQAYAFPPFGLIPRLLAKVCLSRGRADARGFILASETLVSGLIGNVGGGSSSSAVTSGSAPSAPFSSLPSQPPRSSVDWLSHCERSARTLGFSASVAHQLARSRRSSTRHNYQSKWVTYRNWCHCHGRSVSSPTIPKVADFILYLRRSLHMSYSSIASYHSMLSATFCFILPEISSHPVLHDLLRSFRIKRPLPSSRVPPWDLSLVLFLLRGPPFEPLVSCSLRDLTRKVLFLLLLATARRVGELQMVAAEVSFSRGDSFLSYLPEFRAKSESEAHPLPCSFWVPSLTDFVGGLPDELLLCPVRALRIFLHCTSSLSPRPRSLFVSPRSPHALSKNALSYFLHSVIL